MLTLRTLSPAQTAAVYHTHLVHDFAADEVKPLSTMLRMMGEGDYVGYGLYRGDTLCGYAFLLVTPANRCGFLDYFAVVKDCRNTGMGGVFLSLLRQELSTMDGILLEAEQVAAAITPAERNLRRRRIAFYKRCGVRMTGLYSRVFGVDFAILFLPCGQDLPDSRLYMEMDTLYRRLFPKPVWARKVFLGWRA